MDGSVSLAQLQRAVWLVPAFTALHFLEEAPNFSRWARRHISTRYTDSHWRKIHALGMLYAIAFTALVSWWPTPSIVFLFAAFCLTPMLFNMAFHVLTSALYRSYSPGVVSALLFYPVVFWYLVALFSSAGLLRTQAGMTATAIGAVVHTVDLATTTYFINVSLITYSRCTNSTCHGCTARSTRATVGGSLNRLGPAAPGLMYSTPFCSSLTGLCEWPLTTIRTRRRRIELSARSLQDIDRDAGRLSYGRSRQGLRPFAFIYVAADRHHRR